MHSCRVNSVDRVKTVDLLGDRTSGNLMNESSKTGIFLRRTSHHGKRPDRVFAVIYLVDFHQRKGMHQAIVPYMISERTFRFVLLRIDRARNNKICIRRYTEPLFIIEITETPISQRAGENSFR